MIISERIMSLPKWKSALAALALIAAPASAAAQPANPVSQPGATELAAAHRLMEALLPKEQRDLMMEQMMSSMMTNLIGGIRQGLGVDAQVSRAVVEPVLDRFVERQKTQALAQLKTDMPDMIDAMSRAYARRFSVSQLDEMHAFFGSPTGQRYVMESVNIMADPDLAEWQRNSMAKSMEKLPEELKLLQKELEEALGRSAEEDAA